MVTTEPMTVEQAAESLIANVQEETPEAEDQGAPEETDAEEEIEAEGDEPEGSEETGEEEDPEDDGQEVEEDEADEEPRITVKVDGEEREVTLEELKRSYSGQAYIQKGMNEAAEAKKEVEAVYSALNEERARLAQVFERLQQEGVKPAPKPPARELLDTDPVAYLRQQADYEQQKAEYDAQQAQFQEAQQGQSQAMEHARQKFLREQGEALKAMIPDFADAKKAREVSREIAEGAQAHYNLAPDEVGQIMDARHIAVLHDAIRYRKLQATDTKKATEKARPVLKAKASKAKDPQKAKRNQVRQRLKQTGSVDDAVALILKQ